MDFHDYTSKKHLQVSSHTETQESFRQNFSSAEKILQFQSIFPVLSDDHDIKKVTREKVEKMLYAHQSIHEGQNTPTAPYLGPMGINQWIWTNRVERDVPSSLLREYLKRSTKIDPFSFLKKYEHVSSLLTHIAKFHSIPSDQIKNKHLVDPLTLQHCMNNWDKNSLTLALLRFLSQKSKEAGFLDIDIAIKKSPNILVKLHPRVQDYKIHLETKGFVAKHIRNSISHVQQLLEWLCSNISVFSSISSEVVSIFQIQNEHLLAYRSYKLKLVKQGICSPITFTHMIYSIRSFYHYLKDRFGFEPPLRRFRSIKAPRYHHRELPTEQEVETFFNVVEQYAANPLHEQIGYRFMYDLGLRLSEVSKIKWSDINMGTRRIVVHSKGKKSHILYLNGQLFELLQEYQSKQITQKYLLGENHRSIGDRLYHCYKLYTMIAGWSFPGGVHLFRHMFITRHAMNNVLPQKLKEIARVQMVNTVGLYVHVRQHDQYLIDQINLLKYK
ncbi:tyrosine-type recombinase/integrase [Paenibacillus sp. 2TAB23]|uniref:tyrosine-type recombinase/integrase n=1 Tax=Paenibacillus sp. 2TAB23 TaxID=3233004 RepID=UPI003F9E567E